MYLFASTGHQVCLVEAGLFLYCGIHVLSITCRFQESTHNICFFSLLGLCATLVVLFIHVHRQGHDEIGQRQAFQEQCVIV